MKFLLLALVIGIGLYFLLGRSRHRSNDEGRPPSPPAPPAGGGTMLSCAHCGVHLPSSEALVDTRGRHYCSEAHRASGPR